MYELTQDEKMAIEGEAGLTGAKVIAQKRGRHGYPDRLLSAIDNSGEEWRGWYYNGDSAIDIRWDTENMDGWTEGPMNPNDYLTTQEAAAEIGVSLREIQRKITAGILPATKRAGSWFIARSDLDAARTSHERGPGRPAADATLRAIGVEVVDAADSRPYRATPAGIAAAASVRQQQAKE